MSLDSHAARRSLSLDPFDLRPQAPHSSDALVDQGVCSFHLRLSLQRGVTGLNSLGFQVNGACEVSRRKGPLERYAVSGLGVGLVARVAQSSRSLERVRGIRQAGGRCAPMGRIAREVAHDGFCHRVWVRALTSDRRNPRQHANKRGREDEPPRVRAVSRPGHRLKFG